MAWWRYRCLCLPEPAPVRSGQALESKTDAPRVVNSLLHHLPPRRSTLCTLLRAGQRMVPSRSSEPLQAPGTISVMASSSVPLAGGPDGCRAHQSATKSLCSYCRGWRLIRRPRRLAHPRRRRPCRGDRAFHRALPSRQRTGGTQGRARRADAQTTHDDASEIPARCW